MKKIFTLAAIALFTLASCSDDNATSTTTNPEENVVLIKKTIETDDDGDYITEYNYDGTKLTNIQVSDGTHEIITYEGDLITEWKVYDENNTISREFFYEYNSANQLEAFYFFEYDTVSSYSKTIYTYNVDGSISYSVYSGNSADQMTYFLNDGSIYNNRLLENLQFSGEPFTGVETFTFDGKNNPFKNITGYDKISFAGSREGSNYTENITSKTYHRETANGNTEIRLEESKTYTYNSDDYPVTSIEVDEDGSVEDITTQYFYE